MLRITLLAQSAEEAILGLEGWLMGKSVQVLAVEGEARLRESNRLILELAGVRHIDAAGLALLQGWSGPQLSLRAASPYLRSVLSACGLAANGQGTGLSSDMRIL
jgi:ABC-type transporter Mla MlaB component